MLQAITLSGQKVETGLEVLIKSEIDQLKGKRIGLITNPTGIDSYLNSGIDILFKAPGMKLVALYSPEHGIRGDFSAGDVVGTSKDPSTGLPVYSLYGTTRKPTPEMLKDIGVLVYDIQDIGSRSYTFISTLGLAMEAAAENNIPFVVLDRPNPLGGIRMEGAITKPEFTSFVSQFPIPYIHGLTVGELAELLNGEGLLKNKVKCDLTVIKCKNYTHRTMYELSVRPSPNLPNMTAVYLYPSLCFFEGTSISLGRGTPFPFQVYGSPLFPDNGFSFTPESRPESVKPPLLGVKCYGVDLRDAINAKLVPVPHINLEWLIDAYRKYPEKDKFFTGYFDVLAAGPTLREQIIKGMSSEEIRNTWKEDLEKFGEKREKYLLYE